MKKIRKIKKRSKIKIVDGCETVDGLTSRQWAEVYFNNAVCPECVRGIDHHFIVYRENKLGEVGWFALCYEQPIAFNTAFVWNVDDSGLLTDNDDGVETSVRLSCEVVTTIRYDVESASPGGMRRLETLTSSGLFGIIPPELGENSPTWGKHMRSIEADEVMELRMHLAHLNVDLESFDESVKSAKRMKRGW